MSEGRWKEGEWTYSLPQLSTKLGSISGRDVIPLCVIPLEIFTAAHSQKNKEPEPTKSTFRNMKPCSVMSRCFLFNPLLHNWVANCCSRDMSYSSYVTAKIFLFRSTTSHMKISWSCDVGIMLSLSWTAQHFRVETYHPPQTFRDAMSIQYKSPRLKSV